MAKAKLKTEYTDPTYAEHPPGGKHHDTDSGSSKFPTDRRGKKAAKTGKKPVAAKNKKRVVVKKAAKARR